MKFITGHNDGVKFQMLDSQTGRFQSYNCKLGNLSKVFVTCVHIDRYDEFLYAGTRSGEVLEIILKTGRFTRNGPVGKIFKGGVTQINSFFSNIYVGCQNGNVSKMDKKSFLF